MYYCLYAIIISYSKYHKLYKYCIITSSIILLLLLLYFYDENNLRIYICLKDKLIYCQIYHYKYMKL